MSTNVESLKVKRSSLKGTTTRLENFLTQINEETSLFEINARLERAEKLYEQFQQLDTEMSAHGDAIPDREPELDEFENRYFRIKAKCQEIIAVRSQSLNPIEAPFNSTTVNQESMQRLINVQTAFMEKLSTLQPAAHTSVSSGNNTSNSTSPTADVRLPKINVPIFDGKYAEFTSFFDLFTSSIHNNVSLSAGQKFQYLKGLLKDEPANLLRHLSVSDQNYEEALIKLKTRYDKPVLVVDALIETFFAIPKAENLKALRHVSNVADEVMRGLRAQGVEAEKRDPWLIKLLCKKIDKNTQQAWVESSNKSAFPTLDNFIEFVNDRCDALERVPSHLTEKPTHSKPKVSRSYPATIKRSCVACSQNHHLSHCPKLHGMNVAQRVEFIKQHHLCFNCMQPNHGVKSCTSKNVCTMCGGHHHSMIHVDRQLNSNTRSQNFANTELVDQPSQAPTTVLVSLGNADSSQQNSDQPSKPMLLNSLLPTARVLVKDNLGFYQNCNVLLDSGCQNTLISENCVQRLGVSRSPGKLFLSGLGNNKAGVTRGTVELQIKSMHSEEKVSMLAHIFSNLTSNIPSSKLSIQHWNEIKHLPLADKEFDTPKTIDILIGYDYFFSLIRYGRIFKNRKLLAQNTAFGWVICSGCNSEESVTVCHVLNDAIPEEDLNKSLRLFWEFENLRPIKPSLTEEESKAESLFETTTIRSKRYSVRLPFKSTPDLGETYSVALRRLTTMERKFNANSVLRQSYGEFMNEYISLGHMELVPEKEIERPTMKACYLPHHAVIKDSSITTKLRVVFDGSSKSSNGKSLNDNLLKGPVLQQDLNSVLLRFRTKKFCFSADIKQMFRMIDVQECDRNYQRILWRNSPAEEIKHYRLTTVTYGTTSAPYLSIRTLLQLSRDEMEIYPTACEALRTCFYVDDCMTGSNSLEDAQQLAYDLKQLLMAGGFHLRKWATNVGCVLSKIPESDKFESIVAIPSELTVCLLGINWNPSNDCFSYKVKPDSYCIETKRKLLSEISKIYDPLGWISPVVVAVKILIQKLWLIGSDWDDPLPLEIKSLAEQLFSDFYQLNNVSIPRIIFSTESEVTYHGFCDASSSAYAAVIYCRKISSEGLVTSNIVLSKTKVAPISMVSIPRLELCAAYLLAQLFEYIIPVLQINMKNVNCWSDSKTALAWLSSHPSKWKTFVSHRTGYILETLPDVEWRYVPSKLNPADCASRGVRSSYLIENEMWFHGPPFLLQSPDEWPKIKASIHTIEESRTSNQVVLTTTMPYNVIDIINERVSSFLRMSRVLSYLYRAVAIFRSKRRNTLPLQVHEIQSAEYLIFKHYQESDFADTLISIKKNVPISNKKLRRLSPFLDENGVLRVGGRLTKANLPYDSQHQIILQKDCAIALKIVRDCHLKNLHAGVSLLIATLRQKYWIIGARELAKRVYYKCTVCHRYRNKANDQLMGDLPKFRVNANYPFYEVGCDYAGPIMLKQHNGRRPPLIKSYIAVFICLVTKAVHLELVSDLSTDAFLAALDRFIARRGLCGHIHSDNGTNFQGAAKRLKEICKDSSFLSSNHNISNFLSSKGIQWHFIPPGAPHFGGTWESTVKCMKYHIRRSIGQSTLNFEELSTLLARIEAILNSRPLVQADSDDEPYLTPGHFLIGRPLNAVPEVDLSHVKTSTLSKWRLIQQITQHFWSRWSNDYLLSLQPKAKWLTENPNLTTNDVVLLREENLPPACWKLGRVIETHPGSDGLVRVATIKTESTTLKRPITKLYPLPKDA